MKKYLLLILFLFGCTKNDPIPRVYATPEPLDVYKLEGASGLHMRAGPNLTPYCVCANKNGIGMSVRKCDECPEKNGPPIGWR